MEILVTIIGIVHLYLSIFSSSTTQINSLYEKSSYSETYYICFSYNKDDVKYYKLPAKITAESYGEDSPFMYKTHRYYLEEIYWPNGNVMHFFDQEIKPNQQCMVTDSDYSYFVELTTQRVNDN